MKDVELIYFAARILPPPDRPAYLAKVCGNDPVLRARVEQMLAVANEAESFIADPEDDTEDPKPAHEPVKAPGTEHTEAPDEAIGTMLGPYKLLERVGEGGCGVVYVAKQLEPVRRRVALKVIKLGMDTKQVVARFEAERQALAMMDHPNIAKVLEAGTTTVGRPYFVMELVRGVRITDYCEQANLSTRERLDLFIKICHAIQHAHQKGVIHRDIKPSNILVTLHDGVPVPKVIDFGIAKATEGRLSDDTVYTQLHHFIGTPAYMSPEQAEMSGLDVDTRSDIYSLGVLLYEMLAGSTPFDAKELLASGLDAMRKTIREKEPPRPSTKLSQTLGLRTPKSRSKDTTSSEEEVKASSRRLLRVKETISMLRGDLDWIVMKCLEKDRSRRYETANGLAADLKRHLNHQPVDARPPSTRYRLQKSFRRNKLTFAAAGAVAGALCLGVAVSAWQAVRATQAKQAEKVHATQARLDRDRALQAQSTAVQQRDLAQQRLYDSLVREAQSIRTIRPPGFRRQLIDRLQKALAIPNVVKDMDVLRSEVAQCLGDAIGFDPVRLIDPPSSFLDAALNHDGTLVAYGTEQGHLVLHETGGGKAVTRLNIKAQPSQLAFTPDGRSLFGVARAGTPARVLLLEWRRAGDGTWLQQSERPIPNLRRLIATAQGVLMAVEDSTKKEIHLVHAATDRPLRSIPLADSRFPLGFDVTSDFRLAAYLVNSGTNRPNDLVEIWDLQTNGPRTRLSSSVGPIRHLYFSPDSRYLACTGQDGVLALETSHFTPVNTYREFMSPRGIWCGDGGQLALPSAQQNGVRLCSVTDGADATRFTMPHQVSDIRSSLDGSVLMLIPYTGDTMVVKLADNRERRHLTGHVGGVPAVVFSPDGETVASTGKDGTIRLWETQTGKMRRTWSIPQGDQGQTIGFSPDGRWLASGNYQNEQVLVWALDSGAQVLALGDRQRGSEGEGTWTCAFTPDSKILVTAGGDGLRAWELATRTVGAGVGAAHSLEARELFREPGDARNLQIDPTGKWVGFEAGVQRNGAVLSGSFIRGLESESDLQFVDSHRLAVQGLDIDFVGRTLMHMTRDRTLHFIDLQSRASTRTLSILVAGEVSSTYVLNFKISPDGSKVAVANHNGRGVNIHDLASGRRLYTLPDEAGSIWWLAWHPNGRQLAVSRGDGDISIWNLSAVEALLADVGLAP